MTVIESGTDLEKFLKTADPSKPYACLSQTTMNASEVKRMGARLKEVLPDAEEAAEVCHATKERQEAVRKLAEKCPVVLVVGSPKSSNTRRLCETARDSGAQAYLLAGAEEFRQGWIAGADRIGITSGASAPEYLVQELCDRIRQM